MAEGCEGGPQESGILEESTSLQRQSSMIYLHAQQECQICEKHVADNFCDADQCNQFLCSHCLPAHNKILKHSNFVRRVAVSEVTARCCTEGHSGHHALHLCETCVEPVCDKCLDVHLSVGHTHGELQSAIASRKTQVVSALEKQKSSAEDREKTAANNSKIESEVDRVVTELHESLDQEAERVHSIIEDERERKKIDLRLMKKQLKEKLHSPSRNDDAAFLVRNRVKEKAQMLIESTDASTILNLYEEVMADFKRESDYEKQKDSLCSNPIITTLSRLKLSPAGKNQYLSDIRPVWERVSMATSNEANLKQSVLAPQPGGGFVMGATYSIPESQSPEKVETKLHFFGADGRLSGTKVLDNDEDDEDERVRGVSILPCGKIAVLKQNLYIYDFDKGDLKIPSVTSAADGHGWQSIAANLKGPDDFLLGDCRNNAIDIVTRDGVFTRSIPLQQGVTPWQLHALPDGRYVVAQPGFQDPEPVVNFLKADGSIEQSISDKAWQCVYCAVDGLGNVYIAHLKIGVKKGDEFGSLHPGLTLERFTHRGEMEETILDHEVVEDCLHFSLAAQHDGTSVALCFKDRFMIFK